MLCGTRGGRLTLRLVAYAMPGCGLMPRNLSQLFSPILSEAGD